MKKKLARILCIILSMSIFLSGCGSKKEGKKDETKQKVEVSAPGTFPIVNEKITLKFFAPQQSYIENLETNEFVKYMEEKTNIHIEWETVPSDALKEKKSIVLATNEYPDVFFGTEITKEEEMLYGPSGIFVPLNPLIDKYGTNIKKVFNEVSYLKDAITTPDGNIYTLPEVNECYHCTLSQKMWINQKWLDKLGLKMPTTTEEFRQVLKTFKEKDPNGNGKADEIPLTGAIKGWHNDISDFIMCSFIYYDGQDNGGLILNNKKVDIAANKPEFRDGLRYLNSLYKEGLIDSAAFTQNTEQLKQLGEKPDAQVLGAVASGWFGTFTSLKGDRHKDYTVVPPLKGPKGVQVAGYYPFGLNGGQFAITKSNKYPEATARWIDCLFSEEGTRLAGDGREGKEWRKAETGEIGINGKPAKWKRLISFGEIQNVCFWGLGPKAVTSDYRLSEVTAKDPMSSEGFETRLYQETQKYEPYKPNEVLPELYMKKDQINEVAQLKSPINDYVRESMARFITGGLDIEKDWDNYVKGLNDLGLEKYLKIMQDAYDNSVYSKK